MKRIILTFALLAFASAALADNTEKKPSCAGFVSNGFWDNWELSAGAGVGTALTTGKNLGSFGDRLGLEGNFSVTKWIHPIAGVRLQLQGGRFNNYDPQSGLQKWPYVFVHTDLMLNLSNWIGGYREDRAYYAVPFFGFGYMASNFTDKSIRENGSEMRQDFAATFGILNKFRISQAVDFNIELKSLMTRSGIAPTRLCGSYLFGISATAGFTYRFNARGWQRGCAGYSASDIEAFQQAVADGAAALIVVEAENARLAEALKAAQAAAAAAAAKAVVAKPAPVVAKPCPAPVIFYNIGKAALTPQEKTRLELIAEQIKAGSADQVYSIQGHADKQTGTAKFNKRLSVNRAKAVYDFLISKGVNAKQLTYEGLGGVNNPFTIQKANRSVLIK